MDKRIIYQDLPHGKENEIGLEIHAVYKSTRDQCGSDDGKHHLVSDENKLGDFPVRIHGSWTYPMHEGFVEIPYNAPVASAETKRIPEGYP